MRPPRQSARTGYRVFISHASDDLWVAEQLSRAVEGAGAATFLDRRDIAPGDNFKERIRSEIPLANELLALFTPWSRRRGWVRHEIGMADALGKRIVCVFYKVSPADFADDDDKLGPIDDLNIVDINDIETYLRTLRRRVKR